MDGLDSDDMVTTARAVFEAFRDKRRADIDKLLARDFTFTSPYDDAIDRDTYFRRCWPNNERLKSFEIERAVADADGVFVTYLFTTKDDVAFRNTEYLTIADGKLTKVDVYFGASYRDGKFVAQASG
jgi:ketosteroid isomerase-like protein